MYRTYTQKATKHWYFQKVQIANYSSYYPRKTNFHSSILAWIIPWQRSLVGYSPWDHKELDMTE